MTKPFVPPPRTPRTDAWIGLDLAAGPDLTGIVFLDRYAAEPDPEETIADEWARTGRLAAAGVAVGTAIAFVLHPHGTAAIVADLFRWWLL